MSTQVRAFLFGVYALGLIPSLLLGGGASDRWGRRAVVLPAVALSPVATVVLIAPHHSVAGLTAARLLAGVCSGIVFSAASAWVAELSADAAPGTGARRAAYALSAGFGLGPMLAGVIAEVVTDKLTVPYLPHLVLGVAATVLLLPGRGDAVAGVRRPLVSLPSVTRSRRFLTLVAPVAPWVFGSAALSIAFLPGEITASPSGALAFAGVLTGVTLGTGVLVQPVARRLDDRRPLLAGQVGLVAAAAGTAIGIVALGVDHRSLLMLGAPVFGIGYGCCLVSGLRETERISPVDQRGATVAVFYALTYLGFAAPYVLGGLAGLGLGDRGALTLTIGVAALGLVVVSASARAARREAATISG